MATSASSSVGRVETQPGESDGLRKLGLDPAYENDPTSNLPGQTLSLLGGPAVAALGDSLPQCRNLTPEAGTRGRARSIARRKADAVARYAHLVDRMSDMQSDGRTLRQIAASRHSTRRGKPWSAEQVRRVLRRAKAS